MRTLLPPAWIAGHVLIASVFVGHVVFVGVFVVIVARDDVVTLLATGSGIRPLKCPAAGRAGNRPEILQFVIGRRELKG